MRLEPWLYSLLKDLIPVHSKGELAVLVRRYLVKVEGSLKVVSNSSPFLGCFPILLIIQVELFLYTVCAVSFPRFPGNPHLALRSYSPMYLIREAYIMPVLTLWLENKHSLTEFEPQFSKLL